MKIFDFHLHPGYDFHNDELGYEITPERFVAGLRAAGVSACAGSVIHKGDSQRALSDYAEILPRLNREAFAFSERYPNFYFPGIHVHADFAELSCREIEFYAGKGVKLVGELVPYLMCGGPYADKRLIEILQVAEAKQMVLSIHPSQNTADMETLFRALPNMNIVVAHLDGYGLYDWQIDMMRKYDNVYTDLSAYGAAREGMLRDAVNRVGRERILYGSDYPGYRVEPFIDAVLRADLTENEREAIFCQNAERLLGVKLADCAETRSGNFCNRG